MTSTVISTVTRWSVLFIAVVISLAPFLWMVRTAFAGREDQVDSGLRLLPPDPTLANFSEAWTRGGLGHAMLVGVVVTALILVLQLAVSIPASFALAKLDFPGRNAAFGLVLACMLIPGQATALPLYIGIGSAGFGNTFAALVIPFTATAIGLFLLRQHMVTIPDTLLEAARTDGLGLWRTLVHVVVPNSRSAIATFSVLSVFAHWNDYMWPLLIARSDALYTPPLALAVLQQGETGTDYGALSAGALIVTLPMIALFLAAQQHFARGIAGGEAPG